MFTTRGKVHNSEWCVGVSGVGSMVAVGATASTATHPPPHSLKNLVVCTGQMCYMYWTGARTCMVYKGI